MPNTARPEGFKPVLREEGGGVASPRYYTKASGSPTIFKGDLVLAVDTGGIIAATATGLFAGVALTPGVTGKVNRVGCIIDPNMLYTAQGNGAGTLARADVWLNINATFTTGNAESLISKMALAEDSKATTNSLDAAIVDFLDEIGNDEGPLAHVVVMFRKHLLNQAVQTGV